MSARHETSSQSQSEVISSLGVLADFDKDDVSAISNELRRPRGRTPHTDPSYYVSIVFYI